MELTRTLLHALGRKRATIPASKWLVFLKRCLRHTPYPFAAIVRLCRYIQRYKSPWGYAVRAIGNALHCHARRKATRSQEPRTPPLASPTAAPSSKKAPFESTHKTVTTSSFDNNIHLRSTPLSVKILQTFTDIQKSLLETFLASLPTPQTGKKPLSFDDLHALYDVLISKGQEARALLNKELTLMKLLGDMQNAIDTTAQTCAAKHSASVAWQHYILIDYENVQPAQTKVMALARRGYSFLVFAKPTDKISISLAATLQPLHDHVHYILTEATGKNALDFHIASMLGMMTSEVPGCHAYILSKDGGYDSLIRWINARGCITVKRIKSLDTLLNSPAV